MVCVFSHSVHNLGRTIYMLQKGRRLHCEVTFEINPMEQHPRNSTKRECDGTALKEGVATVTSSCKSAIG